MADTREREGIQVSSFGGLLRTFIRPRTETPKVEPRTSMEDLIRAGAYPIADGYALFPFSDADQLNQLDSGEETVDRIGVYFQTIANIRREQHDARESGRPSKSDFELGPLIALWDQSRGARLGYQLSVWNAESGPRGSYVEEGFLPILRIGTYRKTRTDASAIAMPPLMETEEVKQLSDALAYLVDFGVISSGRVEWLLSTYGPAFDQYVAAQQLDIRRISNRNRGLWDFSPLISKYGSNEIDTDRLVVSSVVEDIVTLAEKVRIYGSEVKIVLKDVEVTTPNGDTRTEKVNVAVVSIPQLGEEWEILQDHYFSDSETITKPDRDYALHFLIDTGVITVAQRKIIKDSLQLQKLLELHPLNVDPIRKLQQLVHIFPYDYSGNTNHPEGVVAATLLHQYGLGRYDVYAGYPITSVNLLLDVLLIGENQQTTGRDVVYVFRLDLKGIGESTNDAKHRLVTAYYAYANRPNGQQPGKGRGLRTRQDTVPLLYRGDDDQLTLAMQYRGNAVDARFTDRDRSQHRIVPLQLDTLVRQSFEKALLAMVSQVYAGYLRQEIRITSATVNHPRGTLRGG